MSSPPSSLVILAGSAGALEPIRTILAAAPRTGVTAWVIVQHTAPNRASLLPTLLNAITPLTVRLLEKNDHLLPDHCAVIPPGHDLILLPEGRTTLHSTLALPGPHPSIDALLLSAATHYGSKTIACILSGTGSDGVLGALALRNAGGIIWVQDPLSAAFPELPNALFNSGAYDLSLSPSLIAERLPALLDRLNRPPPPSPAPSSAEGSLAVPSLPDAPSATGDDPPLTPEEQEALTRILDRLAPLVKTDLSQYQLTTILRQCERGMDQAGLSSLAAYADHLARNPPEAEALARSLLIGVTRFWRDPSAFLALRSIWRQFLLELPPQAPLRLWVCGCATGEEVYTLAMLTHDLLTELEQNRPMTILGTDVNAAALAEARLARFRDEQLGDLPPSWLERYFYREGPLWRVHQAIRSQCVFSIHDALTDLPFLHLHLISCRNLLIYLKPAARERLIRSFHYALVPHGILFLGHSETLPAAIAPHFRTIDANERIYQRDTLPTPRAWIASTLPPHRLLSTASLLPHLRREEELESRIRDRFLFRLVTRYAPAAILTDTRARPLHLINDAARHLVWPQGRADFTLPALLPPSWKSHLKLALRHLIAHPPETSLILPLTGGGDGDRTAPAFRLYAERFDLEDVPYFLFAFEPLPSPSSPADAPSSSPDSLTALHQELDQLHLEQAQREALIDSLEHAQTELQTLYDQLQTTSEALQAANEELEASNEELHASNEELRILNAELDRALAEQHALTALLEAIFNALTSPLLVLDGRHHLLRYNRAAAELFHLDSHQLGRPFSFAPPFPWPNADQRQSLLACAQNAPVTVELTDNDRTWLLTVVLWFLPDGETGSLWSLTETTTLTQLQRDRLQLETRLSTLTAALQEAVYLAPAALDTFLHASPRLAEWLGLTPETLTWAHFLAAISPEDFPAVYRCWQQQAPRWHQRYRLRHPQGGWRHIEERGVFIPALAGAPPQIAATLLDVTEVERLAAREATTRAQLQALWRAPTVGIAFLNPDGAVLAANDTLASFLAHTPASLLGKSLTAFTHPESRMVESEQRATLTAGDGAAPIEKRVLAADGTVHWIMQHLSREVHPPPVGEFLVAIWQNIDELKAHEQQIYRQANYDLLTGLPNRSLLRDRLHLALHRAQRTAQQVYLLFLDLDGFKEVNDLFGHAVGDALLKGVAERLTAVVRPTDTVARLGGDEFVILIDGAESVAVAERIGHAALEALRTPFSLSERSVHLSVSIGVAAFPLDATAPEELLRLADTAMYAAKQSGKNRLRFFSPQMDDVAQRKADLKQRLDRALLEGQFTLHCQPVITLPDQRPVGAEALLRWHDPERGWISPAQFIPLAEESGQIRPIGLWVLREAARLAQQLAHRYPGLRLAVNLSPAQFGGDELPRWLEDSAAALPHLIVEVTENVMTNSIPNAIAFLERLRRGGALIAIDDFGTGYSNLSALQHLPIDYLKIDKSLTDRVGSGGAADRIVTAIFQIASAIGARVIVEGVETSSQLAFFRPFAPVEIQGYYFARPMPWDDLLRYLDRFYPLSSGSAP
ncbi:MAG: EAL domain-containing protein [Hydrogenophilus sp.]|nr:EAL domain-containing protein [Hydrogenophilus sp.]